MRGCLFAMQQNCLPLFAQKVFDAYWGRGLDISDEAIIMEIAEEAGLSPQDFKQYIYSQEAKDLLMSNSVTAHRKKRIWFSNIFLSGSYVLW